MRLKSLTLFLCAGSLLLIGAYLFHLMTERSSGRGKFILEGAITIPKNGMIGLMYFDKNQRMVYDSTKIINGHFTFSAPIDQPTRAFVFIGEKEAIGPYTLSAKSLYIEPAHMQFLLDQKDFRKAKVIGSKTQDEKDSLALNPIEYGVHSLQDEIEGVRKKIENGDSSAQNRQNLIFLNQKFRAFTPKIKPVELSFVASHPSSFASPFLTYIYFQSRQISLDSAKMLYELFSPVVKNSNDGKWLKSLIIGREKSSIGKPEPPLTGIDLQGKLIGLNDFKDKSCVLLDFWASWCEPCRELSPFLKTAYLKYHSKGLDIISISQDEDKKEWHTAIKDDNITKWCNIIDDNLKTSNSFAVGRIPLIVLIDKNGQIAGRYFGDEEAGEKELDKKLKELIK